MLQIKCGIKSMKVTAPKPTKEEFHSVGACEPSLLERISLVMRIGKLCCNGWGCGRESKVSAAVTRCQWPPEAVFCWPFGTWKLRWSCGWLWWSIPCCISDHRSGNYRSPGLILLVQPIWLLLFPRCKIYHKSWFFSVQKLHVEKLFAICFLGEKKTSKLSTITCGIQKEKAIVPWFVL